MILKIRIDVKSRPLKFKFIKTTNGSKSLLQVAITCSMHKTDKHYMYTLFTKEKKDIKTT